MRFLSLVLTATCISLSWGIGNLHAAEEWADPMLKVQAGLEMWLDASRLPQAAQYFRQPTINNRDPLETWFDASGHRRHAQQVNPAFRPTYRSDLIARSASKDQAV